MVLTYFKYVVSNIACTFLIGLCLFFCSAFHSSYAGSVSQTKQNLLELEKKIQHLQKRLAQTQDKQTLIKHEVTETENQIHHTQTQLQTTQQQYNHKQREIAQLEAQLKPLNEQYNQLQNSLANMVVARYKMADKKTIIGALKQENPQMMGRLWMYYRYLSQSNQRLMDKLKTTRQALTEKTAMLHQELTALDTIQQKLKQTQHKLQTNLRYRTTLVQTLNQEIRQTQQNIDSFRQSQGRLTKLMHTLTQQSVLQTRHPLSQMKRKLIKPLQISSSQRNMNQGMLFVAPEGTAVQAVFPGKIVFSDWLNAYGLLIIIDHGWGFMTLYANNQTVFKHKGDMVNQGENIASVGHSGAFRQNGLYFEIRHRGKTVPPLQWLK